ncbi:MAG TPA: hypothetical protein VEZ90_11630, partial [Blastocatellia bacterium]|nr:hypothetical protein [Blastocatellia bacterium]
GFDRDCSVKLGVFGLVDHTHTAFANLFNQAVVEDCLGGHLAISRFLPDQIALRCSYDVLCFDSTLYERRLYSTLPESPAPVVHNMTDRDIRAIYEYLSAIPHAEPAR